MDTNLAVEAINEDTEEWIEPGFVHDQDLQSKFSKTNVVFHQLPSQTPKHELNVHGRGECAYALAWRNLANRKSDI